MNLYTNDNDHINLIPRSPNGLSVTPEDEQEQGVDLLDLCTMREG